MKNKFLSLVVLATSLLITSAGLAQDKPEKSEPKFKKTKTHSKSYSLGNSDKVSLYNQFGEMKLITWEKNEIKVDVTITGKSDEEQRAQEILDHISIADGKDGNTVFFKTKFADNKSTWNKENSKQHRHEGMEINYLVYLPAGNALTAENQFGKMIVPDYRGEANIECKFGSLTAGKISNAKNVTVEFGSATIAHVNGGKVNIKFSNGTVNKLSGDVKTNVEYGKAKFNIDNDVKSIDISNSFGDVYLDVSTNLSATYAVSTSHGDFSNKTSFAIKKEGDNDSKYGVNFNQSYSGTSGSGSAKIKAYSSFGQITMGHNLQVDMSEKRKDKNKDKNKTTRSL